MANIVTRETTVTGGVRRNTSTAESSQTIGYIIYFLLGIIEILFIFRLAFKITGANPASAFVHSIYSLSQIFIMPFVGIFPQTTTPGAVTTAVLEPAVLVAMVVYAVLAWGIAQLVVILSGKVQ